MKKVLFLSLVCFLALSANAQQMYGKYIPTIKDLGQKYVDAIVSNNIEQELEYTSSTLIGAIGAETVTAYLEEEGGLGHYLTMAVQEVTQIDQVGTDLHAVVKFMGVTKNGNSKNEVVDYLLAVSHDGGLVWTFLPAGFSQSMKVVQAAPTLKTTLTIPTANTTTYKK